MLDLRNKIILIISPQNWGKMFISKHHYAIALAKRGNEVYFLNPPDNHKWRIRGASKRIVIEKLNKYPGLNLIGHQLYFPYKIRFHAKGIYDFLMKKQVKDILHAINKPVDIIWSFDLGNLYPLYLFGKKPFKIFHPVDEPGDKTAIRAANGSDIIFSVTREILEKYHHLPVPGHFINHGLAEYFLNPSDINKPNGKNIQAGLSGNLLRQDLDRKSIVQIIRENPAIIFNFYGTYEITDSNIGGSEDENTRSFIRSISSFPNVILHGVLPAFELANAAQIIDIWLICYDIRKDQSRGTNYHKVMEYLSTGKVIVSNNITSYQGRNDLVRMILSRENNEELPALFKETIQRIKEFNAPDNQSIRVEYARQNTYDKQLDKIEKTLIETEEG